MGDMGDVWRDLTEESKQHRQKKQDRSKEILTEWCPTAEVILVEIKPWHIRLLKSGRTLDIYPQGQKWHDIQNDKRGSYKDLIAFVSHHFKKPAL